MIMHSQQEPSLQKAYVVLSTKIEPLNCFLEDIVLFSLIFDHLIEITDNTHV